MFRYIQEDMYDGMINLETEFYMYSELQQSDENKFEEYLLWFL